MNYTAETFFFFLEGGGGLTLYFPWYYAQFTADCYGTWQTAVMHLVYTLSLLPLSAAATLAVSFCQLAVGKA